MPRIFDSTDYQYGDDLNTVLAKRLQSLGGTSRWGATDEELQASISALLASSTQVTQLSAETDRVQTAIAVLPATLKPTAPVAAGTEGAVNLAGVDWSIRQGTGLTGYAWHAMAYGKGTFVAVSDDSGGALASSTDGTTWTARTVSTSERWKAVTYGQGSFYAFGSSGSIISSVDGITWVPVTTTVAAVPFVSATYGNGLFVALASASAATNYAYTSTDGLTWTPHAVSNNPDQCTFTGVAYGNGKFVASMDAKFSGSPATMYSTDGITWTVSGAITNKTWVGIAYGNGVFVAVNSGATSTVSATSPDGITWTAHTDGANNVWRLVVFGNGMFTALANLGSGNGQVQLYTSPDGNIWTPRGTPSLANICYGAVYGSGLFIIAQGAGNGGRFLVSGTYSNAEIISSARRIDWTGNCGMGSAGIPVRNTLHIFVGDTTGINDVRAALQAAIDACPLGEVVYLPAGQYRINTQSLKIQRGITLRGAGMGQTIILGNVPGNGALNANVEISSKTETGSDVPLDVVAGTAVKGLSQIVLTANAPASLHVGYIIAIDKLNDGTFVSGGGSGTNNCDNRGGATRSLAQSVEVTGIAGNILSISPPLIYDFTDHSPQVWYRASTSTTENHVKNAGIEELTVKNIYNAPNYNNDANIYFNRAAYCWAKNVESQNSALDAFRLNRSFRLEVRGCKYSNDKNYPTAYGYGINLRQGTCSCLIEDNIAYNTRDFIRVMGPSSANAILYNYHNTARPLLNDDGTINYASVNTGMHHATHPMMNLWEGNITFKPQFDFVFGSSSHNTLLRNWFRGPDTWSTSNGGALHIDYKHTYFNLVGNVLGSTFQKTNPKFPNRFSLKVCNDAITVFGPNYYNLRFGYYLNGDATGGGVGDQHPAWANTIAAGNYDYISSQQIWYNPTTPATIPDSYFYAAKPAFFGSLAWPPIDPASPTVGEEVIPAAYRFAHGVNP